MLSFSLLCSLSILLKYVGATQFPVLRPYGNPSFYPSFHLCACVEVHTPAHLYFCALATTLSRKECVTAMTVELWHGCVVWNGAGKGGERPMVHIECTVIPSFPCLKGFQISYIHRQTPAKARSCHAFSTDSTGPRWGLKTFLCSYTLAKRNYRNIWYCGSGKFAILTLPKAFRNWGSEDLLSQMASKGRRGPV